ncbi:hypothetical protein I4641_16010 [Waterburya agarophytonicola K14]|uniref:Uncharacterized protein n=1 Tax=Waterburya agarophytonicola KI4 TaxID=2874699 RepID=A0A964FGX3_9CYAN|nr:hypothetical protein [Waterburya agarophytonicola]MCC0178482.1 hypothetical protein [Waterburya agarophytonicola KI4]
MFESGDNANRDRISDLESEKNLDNIDANLSPKNVAIRKKQLEKIFIKLIVFGLAFGTVLGIGTYFLLSKLGLGKKPYQLEQERLEQEKIKQEPEKRAFLPVIDTFPSIPEASEG